MRNNLLHTSRWPGTKCSLHLKHRPFARRSAISADENFLLAVVRELVEGARRGGR
jgi:hypothetical protein